MSDQAGGPQSPVISLVTVLASWWLVFWAVRLTLLVVPGIVLTVLGPLADRDSVAAVGMLATELAVGFAWGWQGQKVARRIRPDASLWWVPSLVVAVCFVAFSGMRSYVSGMEEALTGMRNVALTWVAIIAGQVVEQLTSPVEQAHRAERQKVEST